MQEPDQDRLRLEYLFQKVLCLRDRIAPDLLLFLPNYVEEAIQGFCGDVVIEIERLWPRRKYLFGIVSMGGVIVD